MTNPLSSLNHGLSEELNMLREMTRQFVENELAPIADGPKTPKPLNFEVNPYF